MSHLFFHLPMHNILLVKIDSQVSQAKVGEYFVDFKRVFFITIEQVNYKY
jgi:hypothetical protein